MLIDFNNMDPMTIPRMNGGTGEITCRMYNDASYRIIPTIIHPHGSIGMHMQNSGDDLNYVMSGKAIAICDGVEEVLKPGVMHICPKGSDHTIINTENEALVILTIVVAK